MEEFRKLNVEIGSLGTIKKDGVVLEQIQGDPYNYVNICGGNIRVHILVAEAFPEICGEVEKWGHVHHKNENQRDNRAENLIALSPGAHRRVHALEDGIAKGVKAYDEYGNMVGEWPSLKDAERATGAYQTHIGRCCRGERKTAGRLYWEYADGDGSIAERLKEAQEERLAKRQAREDEIRKVKREKKEAKAAIKETEELFKADKKAILEFNEKDEFVREWKSVKEAAEFYNVTSPCIRSILNGNHKYLKQNGTRRYFRKKLGCAEKKH